METAFERGWQRLPDKALLDAAERAGFEVLITTDQNLRDQQPLDERQLSILVLMTTDWRTIRRHADLVTAAVSSLRPGGYVELSFPFSSRR